jgi:hypothetical protein
VAAVQSEFKLRPTVQFKDRIIFSEMPLLFLTGQPYDTFMRTLKTVIGFTGLFLVLPWLASCATTAQFQKMMDGFVGVPISEVQQQFGYNYIERKLPGDKIAYTWEWKEKGVFPGYETPTTIQTYTSDKGQHVIVIPGTYFPQTPYETSCEFTFITDSSGKTLTWRAHGNGCAGFRGPGTVLGPAVKP